MNDDLKAYLHVKFQEVKTRVIEKMRDMQTELLRGFEAFSVA